MAPRKRFGQHFLKDITIIHAILDLMRLKPNDHVIEVGPGQGALTFPILKQIDALEVIELDRDLIPILQKNALDPSKLNIFNDDVLNIDFNELKKDGRLLRIVGNLPYNISTPIIFHLLKYTDIISDMLFMLQKEVAERINADVDTKHYGRLSIMVQYHCKTEIVLDVPPQSFYPPPKVESNMIRILPHRPYPFRATNEIHFAHLVQQAFNQRRKTLRNSLKNMVIDSIWNDVQIDPHLRAENVSVKDFVRLSNALCNKES